MSRIEGIFVPEEKTRFLCTVKIAGREVLCYVPSSCKLEKLISLCGEVVWLRPIADKKSELKYSLYAVWKQQGWVLLNLANVNDVLEKELSGRTFSYLGKRDSIIREKKIGNYKADFFLPDSNTIVEIKTVLTGDASGIFPSMKSKRIVPQLEKLIELQKQGYSVYYFLVALNFRTTEIKIDDNLRPLCCVAQNAGLQFKGYSIRLEEEPTLYQQIPIML